MRGNIVHAIPKPQAQPSVLQLSVLPHIASKRSAKGVSCLESCACGSLAVGGSWTGLLVHVLTSTPESTLPHR